MDKGKTTTTERMLYYSGFTRRLGGQYLHLTVFSLPSFITPCPRLIAIKMLSISQTSTKALP